MQPVSIWNGLMNGDALTWAVLVILFLLASTRVFSFLKKLGIKKFGAGPVNVEFNESEKKKDEVNKVPDCPECANVKDVYAAVIKSIQISSQIIKIELRDTISTQMNFADEQMTLLKDKQLLEFMKKLKSRVPSNARLESHSEYRNYSLAWRVLVESLLSQIKADFLSEVFCEHCRSDANPISFIPYLRDRLKLFEGFVSQFFDTEYTGDEVISRNDLQEVLDEFSSDFECTLNLIYTKAQETARKKNQEIEALKKELNDFLRARIGEELII